MTSSASLHRPAQKEPGEVLACRINGVLHDRSSSIADDIRSQSVYRHDADALPLIRHDAAHILAQAISELFPGCLL